MLEDEMWFDDDFDMIMRGAPMMDFAMAAAPMAEMAEVNMAPPPAPMPKAAMPQMEQRRKEEKPTATEGGSIDEDDGVPGVQNTGYLPNIDQITNEYVHEAPEKYDPSE